MKAQVAFFDLLMESAEKYQNVYCQDTHLQIAMPSSLDVVFCLCRNFDR
jgi:hypothetical protein